MEALREPGWLSWYLGMERELLAAGVLEPYMLPAKGFTHGREIRVLDEYGGRIVLQMRSDGRLRVKKLRVEDWRSAKTIERATGRIVAEILERIQVAQGGAK